MRVFVYEYITGGGLFSSDQPLAPPNGSLLAEGAAMAQAVMADFAALDGVKVVAMRDVRLANLALPCHQLFEINDANAERSALQRCAVEADWTLLIAPEFDDILLDRVRQVEQCGGRLLSPDSRFVALAADKHGAAQQLAAAGVPVPAGVLWSPEQPLPDWAGPMIVKPNKGAGSLNVRILHDREQWKNAAPTTGAWRIEEYRPGLACSVALLCGPAGNTPLPAMQQLQSNDGRFTYLGGAGPLPEPLKVRAQRLAQAALNALPETRGYVGVDLVLGHDAGGADDAVIEINPRLTTSYVGLRRLSRGNLAAAMLAAARGDAVELAFSGRKVEFAADGAVSIDGMAAVD